MPEANAACHGVEFLGTSLVFLAVFDFESEDCPDSQE